MDSVFEKPWHNEESRGIFSNCNRLHCVHIKGNVVLSDESKTSYTKDSSWFLADFVIGWHHKIYCLLVSLKQGICLVPVLSKGCLVLIVAWFRKEKVTQTALKIHWDLPRVPGKHDVAACAPLGTRFLVFLLKEQKQKSLFLANLVDHFPFHICKRVRVCGVHRAGKHEILHNWHPGVIHRLYIYLSHICRSPAISEYPARRQYRRTHQVHKFHLPRPDVKF